MTATLRPVQPGDLDALYDICIRTSNAGRDDSASYADRRLVGDIYAAPYAVLVPEWSFVAEDDEGVAGYAVGAPDTLGFAAVLEARWWPALRQRHADPGPPPHASADAARAWQIHHPELPPAEVMAAYPGHMHMNLLPRARGMGIGRALFTLWHDRARQQGLAGFHVGVSPLNPGGAAFWQACGMVRIATARAAAHPAYWFGMIL